MRRERNRTVASGVTAEEKLSAGGALVLGQESLGYGELSRFRGIVQ